jgi:nucleotide-binding universal stress UspA family protein
MSAALTRPRIAWLVNLYGDPKAQHTQAAAVLREFAEPLRAVIVPVYCLDHHAEAVRSVAPKERVSYTRDRLLAVLEANELRAGEPVVISAGDDPTGQQQAQAMATAVDNADVMFSLLHTRAQSTMDRLLLGSFSERFLEASRRPMLVINPSAALPTNYSRIVFGTDLGNECTRAFGFVLQLASGLKASVRVEHQVVAQELPVFLQGGASRRQHEEELRAVREDAEEAMQPLADEALIADVRAEIAVEFEGPATTPGEGLEMRAARSGASLIAVAAHGDNSRPGDLSSTARWLMRHAQRPVLIIP